MKSRRMLITLLVIMVLSTTGYMSVAAAEKKNTAETSEESKDTQAVEATEELEIHIPVQGTENEIISEAAVTAESAGSVSEEVKEAEETEKAEKEEISEKKESKENHKKKEDKKKKDQKKKKTEQKIKKTVKQPSYSQADLRLMSAIIFCEAGAESYAGKLGVGIVIMNRKASSSFPNTIRGVVYQSGQFSPTWNGSLSSALARYDAGRFTSANERDCIKAAKEVLTGRRNVVLSGKEYNMKSFHFFSRYVSGARLSIGGHQFK